MATLLISVGPTLFIRGRVQDVVEGTATTFSFRVYGAAGIPTVALQNSTLPVLEWTLTDNGDSTADLVATNPTTLGDFTFELLVVDTEGNAIKGSYALSVYEQTISIQPLLITGSFSAATFGVVYSSSVAVSGGVPTYSSSVSAGSLPTGLSLSVVDDQVTLSGTPDDTFRLAGVFPDGEEGVAYSAALSVVASLDATPPFSFSRTSGLLPAGLSLDAYTGRISGTPTSVGSPNTFNFELTVEDSSSPPQSYSHTYSITIVP